jgi:hypothetical protein
VLEHGAVAHAVRELVANALDDTALTGCAHPDLAKAADGDGLIGEYGRGLRDGHLTQKEEHRETPAPDVIGQLDIGLKDALPVFDRRRIGVTIRSAHASITTAQQAKAGVHDMVTLPAIVGPGDDQAMAGTEIRLQGVTDTEIATAKGFS